MESLIITLTANPAIDVNFTVDRLVFDDRAYIQATAESAGGRGVNAACVLHSFGAKLLAVATSGGASGEQFEQLLCGCGFPVEVVRISQEIRRNFTISDRQGLSVKLNEKGPRLKEDEVERLRSAVLKKLTGASWLLLCGSLPPGVPDDFYQQLIHEARRQGVRTLVDADGDALRLALEAGPSVVAPNEQEAERLLNRALVMPAHFREAAQRIQALGAEAVILSLGSRGAVCVYDSVTADILAPRVDSVCPIGAGDALNAAFVWAMSRNEDFLDAARWGVAAGTASACLPGLQFADLAQTEEVYSQVEARIIR